MLIVPNSCVCHCKYNYAFIAPNDRIQNYKIYIFIVENIIENSSQIWNDVIGSINSRVILGHITLLIVSNLSVANITLHVLLPMN
jgi:hypothetical protein